ncbi:dixin-A isoform X2 [Anguilla anguilla]|uniref:dixin-A isoform X2 n=1 Tax=Anguilla anguilla TaxID=7936 RepID=UPI0015B1D6F5|nr:dixin-A isoform X2 [Anguilla anguilla]
MIASLSKGNLLDVLQEGFNEQLAAYVSWVNAQLRKKPGVPPVRDLRQDLRDGVVLAHLIEIVAGELLEGIHYEPRDGQESRENVEKVLQFVSSKRIRMPQTSARDIVEGNLKSAMRLILALAAHFKPSASASHRAAAAAAGRSQPPPSSASHRPNSTMAMAQNAVATLAAARQDACRSGHGVFSLRQEWHSRSASVDDETESPCWSVRALVQQYECQRDGREDSVETVPSDLSSPSPTHTPKAETIGSQSENKGELVDGQLDESPNKSDDVAKSAPCGPGAAAVHSGPVGRRSWEDQLYEQQEQLEREMQEARRMVSSLQALLLHGSLPEDEQEVSLSLGESAENPEQQLVVIRSRLDQSMEESQNLKKELLRYKQESRNLQGVKDALQQRLAAQEASVLQLKQELLRSSMAREELTGQNVELQRKLEDRSRQLSDYKKDLGQKDRLLQQQQLKLDEALRKLAESSHHKSWHCQAGLQRELDHKESLLQDLMNHELDEVSGPQNNGYSHVAAPAPPHKGAEELQLVRDALRSLRNSFSGHDPQHHTLDTLEQGVASLMDRLHAMDARRRQDRRQGRGKSPGRKATHTDRDSWPPSTKMAHSQSSPLLNASASTKVLYFTDRSLTPFMVNIPKRLGEVTLRDFKVAVDREGSFRYHFKALDPEFGTVKEEVFQDEAVVPGWEGKIVAWVEEDHGDGRT